MTEEDWLNSTDAEAMCHFLRHAEVQHRTRWIGWLATKRFKISDRKWSCLHHALCDLICEYYPEFGSDGVYIRIRNRAGQVPMTYRPINFLEQISLELLVYFEHKYGSPAATGRLELEDYWHARLAVEMSRRIKPDHSASIPLLELRTRQVRRMAELAQEEVIARNPLYAQLADEVREIFGNPFCSHHVEPIWLSANDHAVEQLARHHYERPYSDTTPRLLADALEDAGCSEGDMLEHLRQRPHHPRGCWVIDTLLSYE